MDGSTHVTLLRVCNDHLKQLLTALNAAVEALDQLLSDQDGNTAADIQALTERMVEVQRQLLTDMGVFCERATRLLETDPPQTSGSLDTKETEYF